MSEFRKNIGISTEKLAKEIGVSVSYCENIENRPRNPSYNFIKKFLKRFPDADIKHIFFDSK